MSRTEKRRITSAQIRQREQDLHHRIRTEYGDDYLRIVRECVDDVLPPIMDAGKRN